MEIANSGNITIDMSTTPQRDIDFICWGPFTNFNTMCTQLNTAPIEDCSYSASWNETCQINGALSGEFYLLLITNYSNQNCNITFSQTAGNGTTNCCIIAGNAGDDNSLSLCQNDTTFNMFNQILGSPNVVVYGMVRQIVSLVILILLLILQQILLAHIPTLYRELLLALMTLVF